MRTPLRCRAVTDPSAEVTDLLQHLIRNACVNDGTRDSGGEARSADLLAGYFDGAGLDIGRYEPAPGRASLVARLEGSDPAAPTLVLMGHTDVVPVTADRWRYAVERSLYGRFHESAAAPGLGLERHPAR